jgi:tetratricopeptide (TPR) repeat protein
LVTIMRTRVSQNSFIWKRFVAAGVLACVAAIAMGTSAVVAFAAALSVRASLAPERVVVGEAAILSLEVSGAQDVPAPSVAAPEGVRVEYVGPATQVSIVNGRIQASVQHRYSVVAEKPGSFRIGPVTFDYAGQRYEAGPVTLVATAAPEAANEPGSPLRLVVRVPRTRVYVREKLPLEVLLYVGAVRAGDLQYPTLAADGCALEPFGEPAQYQEQLPDGTYTVVRFASTVTPLRSGTLTLGPATTRLNVYERRRGGFFDDPFFSQRRPVSLRSEPVQLDVLPLPEDGKPASFTGAVGRFALQVSASPLQVRTGDPVTLRIVLQGQGNLDGVPPPVLPSSPNWKTYEPHAVQAPAGAAAFEQVVIPLAPTAEIPSLEFSYFDPEAGRYRTERSAPIGIVVQRGEETPAMLAAPQPTAPPEELGRDIVYIQEHPGRWQPLHTRTSPLFVAAHGGLLLLPMGAYLFDRRRQSLARDARMLQQRKARQLAEQARKRCRELISQGDIRGFYDCVARHLHDELTLRFQLPPGAVGPEQLARLPLEPETHQAIAALLAACEEVRFGGQTTSHRAEDDWSLFERVLRDLDKPPRRRRLGVGRAAGSAALLVWLAAASWAASPDALFHQGNAAYAAQDYQAAVAAYEAAVRQGVGSAALFFNLGNAYFKLGDLGRAILNYERAQWLAPRDADVWANLDFARARAGVSACTAPLWERIAFPLAHAWSPMGLRYGFTIAYLLAVGALTLSFLHRRWQTWWRWLAFAAGGVALLLGASWVGRSWWHPAEAQAIALEPAAARFAPESGATEHFQLRAGMRVEVRERRGTWLLVERCDGRRGWVDAKQLAPLVPPAEPPVGSS